MIKKTLKGWLVDIRPEGRNGKRIRKTLSTKSEALRFESFVKSQALHGLPWNSQPQDMRRLSDLCHAWYNLHGHTLRDGKGRLGMLLNFCTALGDPLAVKFNAKDFSHYRERRLTGINSVSPNTVNHEHAYLRAVFNELSRMGEWSGSNPLKQVRRLKFRETELRFLSHQEIVSLLAELKNCRELDAYHVARLCLATGARWGEAEGLYVSHVYKTGVTFENPKDGERRAVPVAPELLLDIKKGKVVGPLFRPCYGAFRTSVRRLGLELPKGQLAHVLRHTFASHFIQNGGDILTLQRVLGHSDLKVTMRYAHLASNHFEQVLQFAPLYSGLIVDKEKGPILADKP